MEFLLLIVVVILVFWLGSVSNRVAALEKRTFAAGQQQPVPPQAQAKEQSARPNVFNLHPDQQPVQSVVPQVGAVMPAAISAAPENQASSETAESKPPYGWLTKIGVLAIAIGLAFFFKYAIDQGWISEWMRVVFGFVVGGLFMVLGELWKEKYSKYAYALSGGGILILDFTIYAAFNFYHLMPQFLSLVLMAAVSALAVAMSIKRKSLALAVLGIVGAYGAPLLLSSGENQQVLLFSYLTLLNLAVLAVMAGMFWAELSFLAFVGTIFDFGVWAANFSTTNNTWTSVAFVGVSTVIFVLGVGGLFRLHSQRKSLPENSDKNFSAIVLLAGTFYFIAVWFLMQAHYHDYLIFVGLVGSLIAWIAYLLIDRLDQNSSNYALSFIGTFLLIVSVYWKFTGKTFDVFLILISAISLIVGYFVKRKEFRTWGSVALYLSLVKVTFEPYGPSDTQFLLNAKFALMLLETVALVFSGWIYSKVKMDDSEEKFQHLAEIIAGILLWLSVTLDIGNAFSGLPDSQAASLWWVIFPPVLAWLAYLGRRRTLGVIAVILIVLGAFRVLILPYDTSVYVFLFNAKFGLMLLMTLALLAMAFVQQPAEAGKPEEVSAPDVLKILASLYLWFAVSWEIVQYFSYNGSSDSRNLLLSVWWMAYGVILMLTSSFVKGFSIYRKVALGFFGLAIAKVFLYDVAALNIGYRIVSFIVLGVILLSVSFAYQKNKEKIAEFLSGDKDKGKIIS